MHCTCKHYTQILFHPPPPPSHLHVHVHTCNFILPQPDSQTDYSDLSDEQYNLTIHSVARNGILNMMSSSERCRQFQQTIMNPLYSPAIHENLLRNLRSYLDQIKRQLPVPALLQVSALMQ